VNEVTAPFGHDLGDGLSLTLRDLTTVEPVLALVRTNLDRLRAAEPWAWEAQTLEGTAWTTEQLLAKYGLDRAVPCVIRCEGEIVGGITLTVEPALGTASLGYWIDANAEGRGYVSRACARLIEVARRRGVRRVEIRAATDNVRSRAVAERLGFAHEGTLRSAMPLGPRRVDVAVYGLVLP
jgi:ribosomal-protein-serine acetyltransferase